MFDVAADAYDAFMGRYSAPLAPVFCDFAQVSEGQRVLDVGCGPGALVAELSKRLGAGAIAAVDPSESFVAATRARYPGVDARQAAAEALPFGDDEFDASLAQLVVHFMTEPVTGLREMARVTRSGGLVAACVWDHAGDGSPLSEFWNVARELDPGVRGEAELAGAREGHLTELLQEAGLEDVEETLLVADAGHASFEEWWEPFTFGVGPAGAYVASLDEAGRERLERAFRDRHPDGSFTVRARAWAARGRA